LHWGNSDVRQIATLQQTFARLLSDQETELPHCEMWLQHTTWSWVSNPSDSGMGLHVVKGGSLLDRLAPL
jgi:hypothetical protein